MATTTQQAIEWKRGRRLTAGHGLTYESRCRRFRLYDFDNFQGRQLPWRVPAIRRIRDDSGTVIRVEEAQKIVLNREWRLYVRQTSPATGVWWKPLRQTFTCRRTAEQAAERLARRTRR